MDPRQRYNDLSTALSIGLRGQQAGIWTALPGIIQSVDAAALTAEIQPAIQGVLSDPKSGKASTSPLPLLVDCPIIFPSGGGVTLTLPIAIGDECLVLFASRCIDAWWQNGGVQPPMVYRMHDLSDGFCLPGVRSKSRPLGGVSLSTAQLRSDDGGTMIELDPGAQKLRLVAPGGIDLIGPVSLGDEGGAKVARVGDTVSGGVITSGSANVKAT